MNERIKRIRKELGLSQTEFGARIGVKQTSVAGYETGARTPLDAVIASICKEFHVNEKWLRTGDGDPFLPMTRPHEIANFVANVMHDVPDSDRRVVLSFLEKWTVEDWEAVAGILRRHGFAPKKEEPNP